MPAYKDKAKGTWYASFYFENWTGKKEKKMKRGFKTKREALEWERTFLQQQTADLDMTFESFVALYAADVKGRIKENTWGTKEHILYKKLVPYFGKRKMSEIGSKEVMAWQSEMLNYRDKNGKPYSPVYLKTLHNQLSAVFNHAVRHYNLKANPAAQVGNMGKAKGREMLFWTKAEHLKFADAMMDKPLSYYVPLRFTVMLSWISRSSCCAAFLARSSWIRRITPLIRIMEKIMMAVVAFLAKLEARNTSVAKEITPRIKRMMLNGLRKARRSRRVVVSRFRAAKLFAP